MWHLPLLLLLLLIRVGVVYTLRLEVCADKAEGFKTKPDALGVSEVVAPRTRVGGATKGRDSEMRNI